MQEYSVKANFGSFPIDMLRYDESFPANESQSGILERGDGVFRLHCPIGTIVKLKHIVFAETDCPNDNRWKSFGWEVVAGSVSTTPI